MIVANDILPEWKSPPVGRRYLSSIIPLPSLRNQRTIGAMNEMKLPADELIDSLQESSTISVKVLDIDGIILSFNKTGSRDMEVDDPIALLGKDWLSFWKDTVEELARDALETARKGHVGYFEGYRETVKRNPRWWAVTTIPLKNGQHDIQWILVLSQDMTELHTLREENASLRARLEANR